MRQLLTLLFCLCCGIGPALAAPANLGVIFLHGKEGMPGAKIYGELLQQLHTAGFKVQAPEMPWSRKRIYDADVAASMAEIAQQVRALRDQGATRLVLIGHSMGANATIRYAVDHPLDALVLLAPGHNPENIGSKPLASDVALARELITAGKGQAQATFHDINIGRNFSVSTTPEIYLSWFDPAGEAVMAANAGKIPRPLPVLLITGSADLVGKSRDALFEHFPPHPASRFVLIDADHKEVPAAGASQIVDWLKKLAD